MPTPEVQSCISQLPALEPLAGAALAISLAYLNLDRFRYRSRIREHARKELARFAGDASGLARLARNRWFRQVQFLAALPDNDRLSKKSMEEHRKEAEKNGEIKNGNSETKSGMPDGLWGKIYLIFFSVHQDRYATYVFTLIALIALLFGCAHQIGVWTFTQCLGSGKLLIFMFYLLSLCVLAPILFVMMGRRVVVWAMEYATSCCTDLEEPMQGAVKKAVQDAAPKIRTSFPVRPSFQSPPPPKKPG